jgi:thiol:disulfide interchange protein DsbC
MHIKSLVIASLIFFSGLANSQEMSNISQDLTLSTIQSKLNKLNSNWHINAIEKSPLENFYRVNISGGKILYYSDTTDYFFEGSLYKNTENQIANITELNTKAMRKTLISEIDVESAIIYQPKGEIKAVVYAFIDVDCGACRELHKQTEEMTELGIEVRYLAYPRAGLSSETYRKMTTAWCTNDRKKSIDDLMINIRAPVNLCKESPVSRHFNMGQSMGLRGTPGIVLMDGTLLHGFRTANKLAKELSISH